LNQEHEESSKNCLTNRNTLEKEILPRLAELERQVKSRQKYEVEKARQEAIASRLPTLLEKEKELEAKISEATEAKQKVTLQLETLRESVEEFEKLESRRTTLSERLAKLREDRATAESSMKYLKAELEQITNAKKELARIRLEVSTQTELIPIYEILEEAFNKDGIPTAILRDLVPEVEEEASRILRDLWNGRMNVNFRFGRQTGRGTVTDELVVEAEDTTGLHPVTRFSGGERMRINLALRLGISEIIANRSGYKGKIETLIIDEGFGALDEEGRQATIEILRQLRQRFRKIIIISNIEDVKDAFDSKLVISKTTGSQSIVEVI
jgi:exonuclease SbcC